MEVTSKQYAVFKVIYKYWQRKGLPPSIEDIANQSGLSKWTVRYHLEGLEKAGLISTSKGHRTIQVVGMQVILPQFETVILGE